MHVGSIITDAGNASFRKTGDWRTEKPVLDREVCIRCALCWIDCPDAAIRPGDDGYYEADLYYCKGCGICAKICPVGAIVMVEEGEQ